MAGHPVFSVLAPTFFLLLFGSFIFFEEIIGNWILRLDNRSFCHITRANSVYSYR
jgi:hypothetical protein